MKTDRAKALLKALNPTRARKETPSSRSGPATLDGIDPSQPTTGGTYPVLFMVHGPQQGTAFPLTEAQVLGRDDEADIVVADEAVSRLHARVYVSDGSFFVEDLGSRNGTYVRGAQIHGTTRVREGDYVRFGPVSLGKLRVMDDLELAALRSLHESTLRDPLTRLYNRRYFDERFRSEFSFAQRHRVPLALMLIDIDHFKRVNDEHGHQAGDFVLRLVAATVQRIMRPEDVVARYGGEEFIVIARNTSLRNGEIFAERIRARIASVEGAWAGETLSVTASVGVTALEEGFGFASLEAMLQAADEALYAAKANGRNRISTLPPHKAMHPSDRAHAR